MSKETLYTIALDMLRTTNVYRKNIEELRYGFEEDEVSLVGLVQAKLSRNRSGYRNHSQSNLTIAFNAIVDSMFEYWEMYPSSFSFKQRMKEKFREWLESIIKEYSLESVQIPEEFQVDKNELDTAVVMIKALHSRKGVNKDELCEKTRIHDRAIQKNLRKLSPGLYAGNDIEKDDVYAPFRLAGQPLLVDIESFDKKGSSKKYYRTLNTMHPIVLQENFMQVATLLEALCRNYYDYESNLSESIASDIWSQLSDYARRRLEKRYASKSAEFQAFIEQLKEACPDGRVCSYRTEQEMVREVEMAFDEIVDFLTKVEGEGRTCTIEYKDESGMKWCLENMKLRGYKELSDGREYELVSKDGITKRILEDKIIDLMIE